MADESMVSVISPVYNAEQFVEITIDSVLRQSYDNWELLLINDGSTDGSMDILRKYQKLDSRIKVVELPVNSGVVAARNMGIELSQGDYVAFLDADDIWLPNKLENQMRFMEEKRIDICFSSYFTIDENGVRFGLRVPPGKVDYCKLVKSNHIGNVTAIYNAKKLGKQYFKENKHEDYIYWLDMLRNNREAYAIKEPLAEYRVYRGSLSANKRKSALWTWKIYRNVLKLSFARSSCYFASYFLMAIAKRINSIICYKIYTHAK